MAFQLLMENQTISKFSRMKHNSCYLLRILQVVPVCWGWLVSCSMWHFLELPSTWKLGCGSTIQDNFSALHSIVWGKHYCSRAFGFKEWAVQQEKPKYSSIHQAFTSITLAKAPLAKASDKAKPRGKWY